MSTGTQAAKHLREVHIGSNWTTSNLKDVVKDLNWQEATTKVDDFNTIAALFYHCTYYVRALLDVLQGNPLTAKDELSFNHPAIASQQDWEQLQENAWANAEMAANLLEQCQDELFSQSFTDEKYGTYYRNVQGIIEHTHYHLGQIVIIKKLLKNSMFNKPE